MNKHTPGPWEHVTPHPKVLGVGHTVVQPFKQIGFMHHIATVGHIPNHDETSAANARLISAAPDMLASLTESLGWLKDAAATEGDPHGLMNLISEAEAAIAKATGEDA